MSLTGVAAASGFSVRRLLTERSRLGRRTVPPLGLVALAAIGVVLLVVIAWSRWAEPADEHAYWYAAQHLLAGQPLYDPLADPQKPGVYWYPPPLAQVLAPATLLLSDPVVTGAWIALLFGCLLYLGGGRPLVALAFIAFLPVAMELWFRNIHLVLAVLVVLALRRSWLFWIPAVAIKINPVIGIPFLVAARRYREAVLVSVVGGLVLLASIAVSPDAWRQFLDVIASRGGASSGGLVPIPYPLRFGAGLALAIAGGRLGGRRGEVLLVVGLTISNPTLYLTAFSLLVAIVPLWRSRPPARPLA